MAITPFLAMTAAEMGNVSDFPPNIAWMACHFSPYGLGLSNLPQRLPPHSLILLDDITPIQNHNSEIIADQLRSLEETLRCSGILLDFQRGYTQEMAALVNHLTQALPCPVIVSEIYAKELTCPVFLPPVPLSVPLEEYIAPWNGREIWLEISLTGEALTLSGSGCLRVPFPCPDNRFSGFTDETLHCHYIMEANEKSARFTLWRTVDDFMQFMEDGHKLGITGFVGLYQELRKL